MPDKWERAHGLKTSRNDSKLDPDKDGLSNILEFKHGTEPKKSDSDHDDVNDGNEEAAYQMIRLRRQRHKWWRRIPR
jgi:hypothetical protein